jgi:hypothetical protein
MNVARVGTGRMHISLLQYTEFTRMYELQAVFHSRANHAPFFTHMHTFRRAYSAPTPRLR